MKKTDYEQKNSSASRHADKTAVVSNPEQKVSDTAKMVMGIKYVTKQPSFWKEHRCGDRELPLSRGDFETIFLTEKDIEAAEKNPAIGYIKSVSSRERWINQLYQNYIKEKNYTQIVNLGSGFDVRAFKKNQQNQENKKHAATYAKTRFWEIDQPVILDEKETLLHSKMLDKNAIYLKVDYTKVNFLELLIQAGLNPDLPTLIIWEGNVMYLEHEEVAKVLKSFKSLLSEFVLVFDYFSNTLIKNSTSPIKHLWKTGIDNIQEFANQNSLLLIRNENFRQIQLEYRVDLNPVQGMEEHSICVLGSS